MHEDSAAWDPNGIVVVPGMPSSDSSDESGSAYPATTMSVVKVLRNDGYPVRVATEEVREISYHAGDVWLPVLHIGMDLIVGAGGNLLAGLIMLLIDSKRTVRAHLKWHVKTQDGAVHTLKFDGDRKGAIEAARLFEAGLNAKPDDD